MSDINKTPKGTQDFFGEACEIRLSVQNVARRQFKKAGSQELDTPVFELKETLLGKYGEDSKLIYNLEDQGGEILSLRYDLTVPFCRFLVSQGRKRCNRYQIQKVYRRDNPIMTKGRYREFYQCDFDMAGTFSPMIADAETMSVLGMILSALGFTPLFQVVIKVNNRKILDGIFRSCGVEETSIRAVSSAIDKLDKLPWIASDPSLPSVRKELVEEKGISEKVADAIGEWTLLSGRGSDFLNILIQKEGVNDDIRTGVQELLLLEKFLENDPVRPLILYDMSLARGLDYYTGLIFEAIVTDVPGVGTFAAGGRYDGLVATLSNNQLSTPCVGMSLGLERVAAILNASLSKEEIEKAKALIANTQTAPNTTPLSEEDKNILTLYQSYLKTLPIRRNALRNFEKKGSNQRDYTGRLAEVCVVRLDDTFDTLRYAKDVCNSVRRNVTSAVFKMNDNARRPGEQISDFVAEYQSLIAIFVSEELRAANQVNIKNLETRKQISNVPLSEINSVLMKLLEEADASEDSRQ